MRPSVKKKTMPLSSVRTRCRPVALLEEDVAFGHEEGLQQGDDHGDEDGVLVGKESDGADDASVHLLGYLLLESPKLPGT